MQRFKFASAAAAAVLAAAVARAAPIPIVNGGFDAGTAATAGAPGWTNTPGTAEGFFTTAGAGLSVPVDPTAAQAGGLFVTANRLATDPDTAAAGANPNPAVPASFRTASLAQLVNLAGFAGDIDGGMGTLTLSFFYNDADAVDSGTVTAQFTDASAANLGAALTFATLPTAEAAFASGSLVGPVPVGARGVTITAAATRTNFSATNVSFDSFSGDLTAIPEPAAAAAAGTLLAVTALRRRRA